MIKKLVLLLSLLSIIMSMDAQDIIFTQASEKIEAKIIEISETTVSYKLKQNPNGPIFKLDSSKVASIIFENGDVFTFKNNPIKNEYPQDEQIEKPSAPQYIEEKVQLITLKSGTQLELRAGTQLETVGGSIYYGGTKLKSSDVKDLIKQTCPAAFEEYKKGLRLSLVGLIPECTGLAFLCVALAKELKKDDSNLNKGIHWTMWAGISCMAVSLPILYSGMNHSNKVTKVFNTNCALSSKSTYVTQYSLQLSPNAVGLLINF